MLIEGGYNACEFRGCLLWEMSGFLLSISNQKPKGSLHFVLRSPGEGAEAILPLVGKACGGNGTSEGSCVSLGEPFVFALGAEPAARGCCSSGSFGELLAGVTGLFPKEVQQS